MSALGEGLGWVVALFFLVPSAIGFATVLLLAIRGFLAQVREGRSREAPPALGGFPEPEWRTGSASPISRE